MSIYLIYTYGMVWYDISLKYHALQSAIIKINLHFISGVRHNGALIMMYLIEFQIFLFFHLKPNEWMRHDRKNTHFGWALALNGVYVWWWYRNQLWIWLSGCSLLILVIVISLHLHSRINGLSLSLSLSSHFFFSVWWLCDYLSVCLNPLL